ncbi:MAG TPA: sugar transferase [Anaerolineales bacterium]|nr:sugar transferase [Anaerolineales bacterium]
MNDDFLSYQMTTSSWKYLNGKLKRSIDVMGALIGLVLGFPIFGVASVIVAIVDKVPVVFTQERIGFKGKPFTIMKLRTLPIVETRDMVSARKIASKPEYRTTYTGKFWRVTSIDEIIQFWLVLKGDMSLIGHRPFPTYYLPFLVDMEGMNKEIVDHYLHVIYQYKPGMSSLSSVCGRGDLTLREKFLYDLVYASQAGFWFDARLIVQTIYIVITCKGAR